MTVLQIISATLGAVAATSIASSLIFNWLHLNTCERIGAGISGAGLVLTIGPTLYTEGTPFDVWSGAVLRLGLVLFMIGRFMRWREAQ